MAAATSFTAPSLPSIVITKCDGSNYLIWASQIIPILRSNDLMNIVNGTEPSPPEFLMSGTGDTDEKAPNPDYSLWFKKDQNCLCWLNSTLTNRVLMLVFHLNTSAAVWAFLENKYSGKNKTAMFNLRRKLQTLSQGARSCTEYIDDANVS